MLWPPNKTSSEAWQLHPQTVTSQHVTPIKMWSESRSLDH